MIVRKNRHATSYCSNIRNIYRTAQARLATLKAERQRAGQRVNDTQNAFLGKIDPAQEQQLRAEANEAVREFQRINDEFERVKARRDEYANDYEIADCQDVSGPI